MVDKMACTLPGISLDMKPVRNPELELLRKEVLEFKQEDEEIAKELVTELTSIHASYLFCGRGLSALAKICAVISSTPSSANILATASWKDLASILGVDIFQKGCIQNYTASDSTEYVLKTYAQNPNATLDKIISALIQLKRYDAITVSLPYLKDLQRFARQQKDIQTCDGILRPPGWKHLKNQLPITLRNLDTTLIDDTISEINNKIFEAKTEENIQQAVVINKRKNYTWQKKYSKRVMLTFAKDGEKVAYDVAAKLRKPIGNSLPIGVLILEDHFEHVEANPAQFITQVFPKMDYVIPIVTPNYLESIEKNANVEDHLMSAIDTSYVKMIHTLMCTYYLKNSCKNDKFRTIIPDDYVQSIWHDRRFQGDLILQAYYKESKVDVLAKRMLKMKVNGTVGL